MNELIKINYDSEQPTVSGRELHQFLQVGTEYKKWFERMSEYGFSENTDFVKVTQKCLTSATGQNMTDHQLTVPMAKEICMLQRNEKGKQARQYFIQLENAWNTPEQVMARALKLADKQILSLRTENSRLAVQAQIMQPKADYFDELVDRNLLTNFRETAKQLGIKEKSFIYFLLEKKYIYRDKRGKLMPYAQYVESGLFEIKEQINEKTHWAGTQTLITPKGRETFRLLYLKTA